jgi:hypothetical protein
MTQSLGQRDTACAVLNSRRPPRPPVVRPEWCETPATYARRVLDQLIDHIVQVGQERS